MATFTLAPCSMRSSKNSIKPSWYRNRIKSILNQITSGSILWHKYTYCVPSTSTCPKKAARWIADWPSWSLAAIFLYPHFNNSETTGILPPAVARCNKFSVPCNLKIYFNNKTLCKKSVVKGIVNHDMASKAYNNYLTSLGHSDPGTWSIRRCCRPEFNWYW